MATFDIPREQCSFHWGRNSDGVLCSNAKLPKAIKHWLKRRKIEYSFEYVKTSTQITEGKLYTFANGRTYPLGAVWEHSERCVLTIPDDDWALQFKLTWL